KIGPELLRMQRELLDKFEQYRSEVDLLRCEVRQSQNLNLNQTRTPKKRNVLSATALNAPAASAGIRSAQRPTGPAPPGSRSKQRLSVQWLNDDDDNDDDDEPPNPMHTPSPRRPATAPPASVEVEPAAGRSRADRGVQTPTRPQTRRQNTAIYTSPSLNRRRPATGLAQTKTTVEDVADDNDDDTSLSDSSTTVTDLYRPLPMRAPLDPSVLNRQNRRSQNRHAEPFDPWAGHDVLANRKTLDGLRNRGKQPGDSDGFDELLYSKSMVRQLADTLAELQRVHARDFHGAGSRPSACPVCRELAAQDQDPYLFGRRAIAYKSMSTRQLQRLLNAYVKAMEDEFAHLPDPAPVTGLDHYAADADLAAISQRDPDHVPYSAFTPTRRRTKARRIMAAAARSSHEDEASAAVIDLLRDELDALSRRYDRLVAEFHSLDPRSSTDQRRRRQMPRELKDLVDMLDVKSEQIAVLASLHPKAAAATPHRRSTPAATPASAAPAASAAAALPSKRAGKPAGILPLTGNQPMSLSERAYQSARALQKALEDLY
ncbi:hypothetical protein FBU59_002354, partial [Linderina macrospora]